MAIYSSNDFRFNVLLTENIICEIKRYAADSGKLETGGIIIGHYNEKLDTATVTLVSGPPLGSRSGRTWFMRGTKGLKEQLRNSWTSSKTFYLGEWHYHPFASPTPSGQDIRQMKTIANDKKYNCPEPLMIILGGDPNLPKTILRTFVFLRDMTYQELNRSLS